MLATMPPAGPLDGLRQAVEMRTQITALLKTRDIAALSLRQIIAPAGALFKSHLSNNVEKCVDNV
jgi:hypothetical protein